jgi:hypothetical protein
MNDPQRLAYLAGVLDAIGGIRVPRGHPTVSVYPSMFRSTHLFQQSFGGALTHDRVFRRNGAEAVRIVRLVRPYLHATAEVADRVLSSELSPPKPKPVVRKQTPKVPCANGCGGVMTEGSKMCWRCYAENASKPKLDVTQGRVGEIIKTPTGIIHKLRG